MTENVHFLSLSLLASRAALDRVTPVEDSTTAREPTSRRRPMRCQPTEADDDDDDSRGGGQGKETTKRGTVCSSRTCAGQRMAAGVMVGAVSLYGTVQGSIKAFHYMRRRQLSDMMLATLPVLQEFGVEHWVDFGSLLGIVRAGELILHDNDVDVVVLNPDWPALEKHLKQRLRGKYRVGSVRPSEDPTVMWLRVYCPFGMMDIYGGHDRGGKNVEIEIGRGRLLDLPKAMVLPPAKISYRDNQISVPGSAKAVLELRYGDTWMIPRYMDKGQDTIEQRKPYVKILRMISALGIRI